MVPGIFKIGGDYSDISARYTRNVQARRKAADDAFNKYFTDQSKTLDPNVVRPVDREAFDDMFQEWKKIGVANKKELMSNPSLRMQHEQMLSNLSRFAQESKERTATKEPLMRMYQSPDKTRRVNEKVAFPAIDAHDQPLMSKDAAGRWTRNPNSKQIDYKQDFWNPKPIDYPKFFQDVAFGKKQVEVPGEPLPNDLNTPQGKRLAGSFEVMQPIRAEYTIDTKKEIGNNAFKLAQSNPEINDAFEVDFKNISKKDYDELSQILNTYFPGEEIKDGAGLAKATALKLAQEQDFEKVVPVADKVAKRKYDEAQRAKSEARADRRADKTGEAPANVFDVIDADWDGGSISDGYVTDKSGQPYTGSVPLVRAKVPGQLSLAMKGLGYEPGLGGVQLTVRNGKIESVTPSGFQMPGKPAGNIDREAIIIGQQKIGPKVNWGKPGKKKSSSDPLGLGF